MIAYLSGKIIAKKGELAIIEVNGVGYEAHFSQAGYKKVPEVGEACQIFCYLEANERGMKILGFSSFEELESFKIIRNIQGIGPKASQEIVTASSIAEIERQIKDGNITFLDGIPGIGRKKAAKVILELSGQITTGGGSKKQKAADADDAALALARLGFSKTEIKNALSSLPEGLDLQSKITEALKILSQ